jgi:diguanylate cyclase (GGDEF)-like protein
LRTNDGSLSGLTRWLTAVGSDVPPALEARLTSGLYASTPIFLGGVINSIVVAAIAVARHPTEPFILWLVTEVTLGLCRLAVVIAGARAQASGKVPPTSLAVPLSCAWAASVGFGAFISIASEDWILASIVCLSTTGMVSGICLRNFGTPRLVMLMMMLCLVPCALAALFSADPAVIVMAIQLPIYMAVIGSAAVRLNAMFVGRMTAQHELERSEALNRSILEASPDRTFLLDGDLRVIFSKRPDSECDGRALVGTPWLDLVPSASRADAQAAIASANAGEIGRLTAAHDGPQGRRWFDIALSRVHDGSGRILVSARDISHQKSSEERALWMANHDPLTGLPNRLVLQNVLDSLADGPRAERRRALLVLDIDNFKLINDTLGHDAGDALLRTFAERLKAAVRSEDLIARLGGDEFAVVIDAQSDEEVDAAAQKIFGQLAAPFVHEGRLLECNASVGAAFYPTDGDRRSELMKAADIALYSAKSAGRGRLKIFRSEMRNAFQARNSMMFLARRALVADDMLPHYQPKVDLRTGSIVGFEALLRWRDSAGGLRRPAEIAEAFEDPALSAAISERIIGRTLADMRLWLDAAVDFGHVAINVAASEFRSGQFAEELLAKLEDANIPPERLQVEVTETVFLGRGANHVEQALRLLNDAGVRIALDDFGTGYASLAQLMHFPVDVLKIDKSFVREIGRKGDAEAITKAIVNLGRSLGIEVLAEGIETAEEELYLLGLGCRMGQGHLYSRAVPSEAVALMLARQMLRGPLARSA